MSRSNQGDDKPGDASCMSPLRSPTQWPPAWLAPECGPRWVSHPRSADHNSQHSHQYPRRSRSRYRAQCEPGLNFRPIWDL